MNKNERVSNAREVKFTKSKKDSKIEIGNIVKYLADSKEGLVGVVKDIQENESTKRHGHSGKVYLVQDPFTGGLIPTTIKENLTR